MIPWIRSAREQDPPRQFWGQVVRWKYRQYCQSINVSILVAIADYRWMWRQIAEMAVIWDSVFSRAARILIAGTPFSFNSPGKPANIVILDHLSIREQHENLENGIWFANTIRWDWELAEFKTMLEQHPQLQVPSATFDKRHAQIKLARSHGIVKGSERHGQNLIEFSCADIWPCFALPLDSRVMLFLLESLGRKQDVSNLENENCFASFDCVFEKM